METVTLTIDGQQVTVPKGKTVLQAAVEAGISVPYYCYHPGISIDGSCRVCVVKIEKMPKLQTSCSTVCTDGMVVSTRDQETVAARAGVFEFLLLNHPLDCPVCDKGGECPLQDFSYTFGPAESRMDFPRRVFDGEGVKADVDFGPTLMLNRNRCILCTRCVRFMREIDDDAQISIADRGNGSEIATFREEGVQSLLSGNLMDVCPVGAITTRQYRFKSRPWDNPNVVDTEAGMGALYALADMRRLAVGHGRPNPKPGGLMSGVDLAKKLLAKGADPNIRLKKAIMQRHHTAGDSTLGQGATPFLRAAKSGDIELMRALVAGGADPKIAMGNGANALFFAAGQGWRNGSPAAPSYDQGSEEEAVEAIRYLLGLGFDIHATNDTGDTPLHVAISGRGSEANIAFLVAQGADAEMKNKRGQTPLALAVTKGNDAITNLLRVGR